MIKRKKNLEAKFGTFIEQYVRKKHAGWDPNDRTYDREFERKIKRLPPEEFDKLLNGSEET